MKIIYLCAALLVSTAALSEGKRSNMEITYAQGHGYYMNVYDQSHAMMQFMEKRNLHGGGPTWVVLLETTLKTESPSTLAAVELDDEAAVVQVRSKSKKSIMEVQHYARKLMSDRSYLLNYVELAKISGHLE